MQAAHVSELLLSQFPYLPTPGQKELIFRLANFLMTERKDRLFMLKGYAGTGKTTVVSALVKVLPMIRRKVVLIAPTGRAAKVLSGYSGHPASTIHRKIYLARTTAEGKLSVVLQENHHWNTYFIVDEASMIQTESTPGDFTLFSNRNLLDDLFTYVSKGQNCHLILVGDTAQLPPVGQTISPALDPVFLKQTYHLQVEQDELTEVVRQTLDSGILINATHLRMKLAQNLTGPPFFHLKSFTDVQRVSGTELEEHLQESLALNGQTDSVIITRSNKRANLFNREVRRRILFYESELAAGELLMVVRNNYFWLPEDSVAGFVANGDIIEILKIKKLEEMYGFRYADVVIRMVDYPEQPEFETKLLLDTLYVEAAALPAQDGSRMFQAILDDYADIPQKRKRLEKVRNNPYFNALQVKYAYALTCHKTQGGQWKSVFVDQGYLKDDQVDVEYLRWLYTAVTRATERLYLVGFREEFFS